MISRIAAWIGGGLLTSALALTGSGSPAPHVRNSALQAAQQECAGAEEQREARDRLQDALAALEARWSVAPALAAQAATAGLEDAERALADAQSETDQFFAEWSEDSDGPGWLGIRMEEVGSEKAKELKLPAERGVVVTYVTEDSPAAKAGLKANDVITEFDGQRVEGTLALQRMVREVPAGRSVSITLWRAGQSQSLRVEMGSRRAGRRANHFYAMAPDRSEMNIEVEPFPVVPPMPAIEIGPMSRLRMFGSPVLGIDAEDLSGQLGNYFGAPDGQGILVREVMPGTPAEKAGLKAGDVILRVDGKRVKNADELRSALGEKQAKAGAGPQGEKAATADITVLRAGKEMTVKAELQPPMRKVRPLRRVAV